MIPKTIHYCWFGRNPKPALAEKCIASWKRFCPDYEIIEWNEDSFDLASSPLYVRQAYEAKKWAFVTDYVRLWAMVNYGGIYMDTDVELLKTLDGFLQYEAFSGFESDVNIPTGIMACRKGFPLFQTLLHEYDTIPFLKEDGTPDLTTNVVRITALCRENGFVANNTRQSVLGFELFPKDVFCPLDWETKKLTKTKNTVTIHWFSASWWDAETRSKLKNQKKTMKKDRLIHLPNRALIKMLGTEKYEKIKSILKREK